MQAFWPNLALAFPRPNFLHFSRTTMAVKEIVAKTSCERAKARTMARFDSISSDSNLLVQILGMLEDKEIGNFNSSISRVDCRNAFKTSLANTDALKMKGIESRHTLTLLSFWKWVVNKKVAVTSIDLFDVVTKCYDPAFIPAGFSRDCEAELATVISDYLQWTWKKFFLKSVRLMECRYESVEHFSSRDEKNYNIAAHMIRSLAGNIVRGHATFGLLSLDLVSCILSRRDMNTVCTLLEHNSKSLHRVNLSELRNESGDDDTVKMDVGEIICCGAQLKELTLNMTRHGSDLSPFRMSPTCWLTISRRCPGLEYVSLQGWRNSLIDDAEVLAEACSNLTSINLNGCCGTHANRLVTLGRSFGPRLQRLYICGFPKGMEIAHVMAECCTNLTHVDFGYSSTIYDANVVALVENCKHLKFVKINRSRVTGDAVVAIARCCPNLMELNIFECRVSKAAVLEVLNKCMRLRTLFCSVSTRRRLNLPFVFYSNDRGYINLIDDWEHSYDYWEFKFPDSMNKAIDYARCRNRNPCMFDFHSFFSKMVFFTIENFRMEMESEEPRWLGDWYEWSPG